MVFVVTVLATGACGIHGVVLFIFKPNSVKLFYVMAVSLLLGYSFGTVITIFVNIYKNGSFDSLDNIMGLSYGKDDISMALLLVLLVSLILIELSRFEVPLVNKVDAQLEKSGETQGKCISISAAIVICAYLTGQIGFMGIQIGELGKVGVLGALAFLIVPPFLPIIACEIIRERSLKHKALLMFVFSLFLFSSVLFGRRVFLYSLVSIFIGLSINGYGISSLFTKRSLTVILGIIAFPVAVWFGFSFFYAMRLASYSVGPDVPLIEFLRSTFEVINNETPELYSQISTNIAERPFILSYLAGIVSSQSTYPPLWGKEVYYAFQTAIPSMFFPDKLILLPKMAEEFVHPAFGLPVFDGNNTIITAGINDFGIIGAITYPAIIVIVYIFILRIINRRIPFVLFQVVLFRLIYQLLNIEDSLSSFLTSFLRDMALVIGLLIVILKITNIVSRFRITKQLNAVAQFIPDE